MQYYRSRDLWAHLQNALKLQIKNKKPKQCDSPLLWRVQNSFQQLTLGYRYQRYLVSPLEGSEKMCLGKGWLSVLSMGWKKCGMIKAKVCDQQEVGVSRCDGSGMAEPFLTERQWRKQGNGRFYKLISKHINSLSGQKNHHSAPTTAL